MQQALISIRTLSDVAAPCRTAALGVAAMARALQLLGPPRYSMSSDRTVTDALPAEPWAIALAAMLPGRCRNVSASPVADTRSSVFDRPCAGDVLHWAWLSPWILVAPLPKILGGELVMGLFDGAIVSASR